MTISQSVCLRLVLSNQLYPNTYLLYLHLYVGLFLYCLIDYSDIIPAHMGRF